MTKLALRPKWEVYNITKLTPQSNWEVYKIIKLELAPQPNQEV